MRSLGVGGPMKSSRHAGRLRASDRRDRNFAPDRMARTRPHAMPGGGDAEPGDPMTPLSSTLARFGRRRYTPVPTPLEPLLRFSRALAATCPDGRGPEVWIKRDDLLGLSPGGNKTRKLEFLVADALARGADTLITCGAPQSNHCRITLAAAIREGLRCRFVIEERVPGSFREDASGNHLLFRLMGVEALSVVPAGADLQAAMQREVEALAAMGRRGYVIPVGGSNALGGLGYVDGAIELHRQLRQLDRGFDALLVGSGSSGTHAGLLAGFAAIDLDLPILGVGTSRDPAEQTPLVLGEASAICALLDLDPDRLSERMACVGGYWQPGYGLPNARMVEAVRLMARTEAILLDPVYTGKVVAGLIGMARAGRWSADQRVLFLHTGGMPLLFANPASLRDGT
ncbi:MAG: D-cysteine desulfhydrase [Lautropia sp.]